MKTLKLYNNVEMPLIGFGTSRITKIIGNDVVEPLKIALESGYKLIDTADYYQNHKAIGDTLKILKVKRKDFFITTKIWNYHKNDANKPYTSSDAKKDLNIFFEELQLDYLDLVLIHWPFPSSLVVWKVLEEYYMQKKIRAIGVSNFTKSQLKDFISKVKIKPMVNQIQLAPTHNRKELVKYCQNNNIIVTSWRTFGEEGILNNNIILKLSNKYQVQPAQICLKWAIQKNIAVIPKSVTPSRIKSNIDLNNFTLTPDDINLIDSIPQSDLNWEKNISKEPNW